MSKIIKGIPPLFLIGFFLWLYISAQQGDVISIVILVVLAAVTLILLGVGIVLLVMHFIAKNKQADFTQNTKENLTMMGQLASAQNQQNAMLLRQAQKALPAGDVIDTQAKIVFEEGLFSDLEDAGNGFMQAED